MLARMPTLSELTALNVIAGNASRSTPATGATFSPLATTYPAPTLIAVPAGATGAEFQFAYTGGALGTTGNPAVKFYRSGNGTTYAQAASPIAPSSNGYGGVSLPGAAAAAVAYSAADPMAIRGAGWVGISAIEEGDVHAGALVVTVVWLS